MRLSSLNGRDWSCLKNTVSRTALSAVGAAFSAGAAALRAPASEPGAKTPASAAIANSDRFHRPMAISLFCASGVRLPDLRTPIIANSRPDTGFLSAALVPANVKHVTAGCRVRRY